jgi:uncharacterized protein (TIGR02996 family)
MSEEAFVRQLLDNPDDDALRLVYADWLEDHGDSRSEFLREAVAVAAMAANDPFLLARRHRLQELRPLMPSEWLVRVYRIIAEDDVRETVFRTLLGDGGWAGAPRAFLQVEGEKDPSWYLFDRLAADYWNDAQQLGIRPVSVLANREELQGSVYERVTSLGGILFQIDALRWIAEDRCEVEGGHFLDGLAAAGNLYQVNLHGGRWTVIEATNIWIS